jgi:hypothetical protein
MPALLNSPERTSGHDPPVMDSSATFETDGEEHIRGVPGFQLGRLAFRFLFG